MTKHPAQWPSDKAIAGELLELHRRSVDEKTIVERAWRAPLKPPAPQQPCDAGLFGDSHKQGELKL